MHPSVSTGAVALGCLLALGVACSAPAPAAPTTPPQTNASAATAAPDPASAKTLAELNAALSGWPASERQAILVAGAQREKAFELYSTMSAEGAQAVSDGFQAAYPFVKAQVFRTSNNDLENKALTEVRAGKTQFDLIDVSPESILNYEDANAVVPYDSPTLSEIPPDMRDPKGYWAYMYLNGVIAAWNTNNVKPEEVPNTYADLLSPRWKNKLSLDTEDAAWANFIKTTMGAEAGTDFLRKLAAQNPRLLQGRTNQLNLLIAGEFDLSPAIFDYSTAVAVAKGAPIAWKYLRPTMIQGEPLLAAKAAPHPFTALLFVDWLFSKDGMQAFHDGTGRMTPRPDVKLKYPDMANQTKGEVWIQGPDTGKTLKQQQKDFADIFKVS